MNLTSCLYSAPCGELLLVASPYGLQICDWPAGPRFNTGLLDVERRMSPVIIAAVEALDEYFSTGFLRTDVPLEPHGTPFQLNVWSRLRQIAPGTTLTYGDIASELCGNIHSARAVAGAIASNLISIFIPCHRVIPTTGIGGYRGSVAVKKYLLDMENLVKR